MNSKAKEAACQSVACVWKHRVVYWVDKGEKTVEGLVLAWNVKTARSGFTEGILTAAF